MADGIRLAVRIWLPEDAETDPVPAVLEAIPYRKDDWTARRDALQHPYVAGHGYAVVRLDLRGSGSSDGVSSTSTCRRSRTTGRGHRLDRGAAVVHRRRRHDRHLLGGFNALQVAARRPPALKAIITLCSTDDRYADDVHYMGGCVLAIDALPWASQMLVWNAAPPDPALAGDGWRDAWLDAPGADAPVRRAVARAPAPRRLLAPGLRLRGLRRDRLPGLRGRRLGRRLHERNPSPARGPAAARARG